MRQPRGFTLIELLVVIAVIAIITGVAIPVVGAVLDEAKVSRAKADIDAIAKAILGINKDTTYWPIDGDISTTAAWNDRRNGLTQNHTNASTYPGWKGPYITRVTDDPWGTPYYFDGPGYLGNAETGPGQVSVMSYGPNRTHNNSRDNANRQSQGDDIAYFFR